MQTSERNGKVVAAKQVADDDELMLITDQGSLVRTRVDEISVLSRNTQGVCLVNVGGDERLIGIERIEVIAEEANGEEADPDLRAEGDSPAAGTEDDEGPGGQDH